MDAFPIFTDVIEMHDAIRNSEKRIIPAPAYVFTWVNFRAALPDDDIADDYTFATEFFHTQSLGMTVTAIAA